MLGTLCRYLRFMGYDAESASSMSEGNPREDTLLIKSAERKGRILLTRDRELARRAGACAILVSGDDVLDQLSQLVEQGLIEPELRLNRCSICNELLRPARDHEVSSAPYAPKNRKDLSFFWCRTCRKLYWLGSHSEHLEKRIKGSR
ncbi:MAG: Mut7-C RNAse domain-containing protein [Methanoregulaceae archaeon]|jgi:hypothetical protein|nr:Mut7-C RNAse domain-containing protein [Methanoregulaceae archaeon]